jgi:hypothetical protein
VSLGQRANHPDRMGVHPGQPGQHLLMEAKTQSDSRRSSAQRAPHNGHGPGHREDHSGDGIDLPVVGHLPVESVGFLVGLGIAGAVGVLEWPVVAAVGIGYALARRRASDDG